MVGGLMGVSVAGGVLCRMIATVAAPATSRARKIPGISLDFILDFALAVARYRCGLVALLS
jgi:hypothetical protein